jgi:hypothetical protein
MTGQYRRSVSACWHAHRDVLTLLFARYPMAEVRTTYAAYLGAQSFADRFLATARTNIGSAYNPVVLTELCECVSYEVGPYTADLNQHLTNRAAPTAPETVAPAAVADPGRPGETPAEYLSRTFVDNSRYSHDYISRVIEQYGAAPSNPEADYYATADSYGTDPDDAPVDGCEASGYPECNCGDDSPIGRTGLSAAPYYSTIHVCVDCHTVYHHAEDNPDRPADLPETWSDVPADRFDVTDGILREAHHATCSNRCPHTAGVVECDCAHDGFSSSSCDGCGSWLAGERFAYTLWERQPTPVATGGHS